MTRDLFLAELGKHLRKVPAEERQSILSYYGELLDERGIQGYMEVPADIGNPRQIAYEIIRDAQIGEGKENKKKSNNVLLIVILSILAMPIGLPLAILLIVLVLVLAVTIIGVIIGVVVGVFAGLGFLFSQPFSWPLFLLTLGTACLGVGIILLITLFVRWVSHKVSASAKQKSMARNNCEETPYKSSVLNNGVNSDLNTEVSGRGSEV